MSKTSGQKDPSMDEILGSIRRIITEDNARSGQPADAAAEVPEEDEEDILELTDEVGGAAAEEPRQEPTLSAVEPIGEDAGPDRSKVRLEPILGIRAPAPPQEVEPEPVAPAGPTAEPQPVIEPAPAEITEPAPSVFGSATQERESAMTTSDEPASAPEGQPEAETAEIVSDTASLASAASLGELSRAMSEKANRLKVGESGPTVSELVKEMLRPMLREWLDENLPSIVERIVRREIQKLVDRTQDED